MRVYKTLWGKATRPDEKTISWYQGLAAEATRANIREAIRDARDAYRIGDVSIGGFVHVHTDCWTSKHSNLAYISVGIRFIIPATDEKPMEKCLFNLGLRAFPGSHNGETIAAKLTEILEEYSIEAGSREQPSKDVSSAEMNVVFEEDRDEADDSSDSDS